MADKEYMTTKKKLEDGAILKEYTQTDFLTVSPAPSIDMVKWQIVKQGTKGKDAVSFYMNTEKFRILCDELTSKEGRAKIAASIEHQYPDAYMFTTGANGSKHLNIGGGRKGIRIQIFNPKKDGKQVVISYESVKIMAFLFQVVMGLIPVTRYYESLADGFWKGYKDREKYFSSYNPEEDGEYKEESEQTTDNKAAKPTAESSTEPAQEKPAAPEKPNEAVPDKPASEKANSNKPAPVTPAETKTTSSAPATAEYLMMTLGPVKRQGSVFYCVAKDTATEKKYSLCFTQEHLSAMGDNWESFQEKAPNGVKIKINATLSTEQKNRMDFVSLVKKTA